jgi:hypothetical protein
MLRRIARTGWTIGMIAVASFVASGIASARDVACGEKCDTKMNQCLATCEKPPDSERGVGDKYEVCQNQCAMTVFHPCLDACKMPKPDFAKD